MLSIWPFFGNEAHRAYKSTSALTGTKPMAVTIGGIRCQVASWSEVAVRTFEHLATVNPTSFEKLASAMPSRIGQTSAGFRKARRLSNNYYVETNMSAEDIDKVCRKALGLAGINADQWHVDARQGTENWPAQ